MATKWEGLPRGGGRRLTLQRQGTCRPSRAHAGFIFHRRKWTPPGLLLLVAGAHPMFTAFPARSSRSKVRRRQKYLLLTGPAGHSSRSHPLAAGFGPAPSHAPVDCGGHRQRRPPAFRPPRGKTADDGKTAVREGIFRRLSGNRVVNPKKEPFLWPNCRFKLSPTKKIYGPRGSLRKGLLARPRLAFDTTLAIYVGKRKEPTFPLLSAPLPYI